MARSPSNMVAEDPRSRDYKMSSRLHVASTLPRSPLLREVAS
ncbi:MAG: hypothetical protein ACJ0IB_08180 [Verrucomicrobiales bacterium]|nr:hypothetical protein [bacterium]